MIELILVIAGVNLTIQLAFLKNNIPTWHNEKFGHKYGNWCNFCVMFWTGIMIAVFSYYVTDNELADLLVSAIASTGLTLYLYNGLTNE